MTADQRDDEHSVTLPCGHRVLSPRPCPTCAAFAAAPDDEAF